MITLETSDNVAECLREACDAFCDFCKHQYGDFGTDEPDCDKKNCKHENVSVWRKAIEEYEKKRMDCYSVTCVYHVEETNAPQTINVGVMTTSHERACEQAVKTLKEGKHITARAVSSHIVNAI